MEALLLPDQSISTHNRVRTRYASMTSFSFHYPEIDSGTPNLLNHPSNPKDSIFHNPPSFPCFSSVPSLQPPLLPLPLARNPSLPSRIRGISPSPSPKHRNNNKTKDQDVAPKKPKSAAKKSFGVVSTARLGPDPSKLPKEVPKVLRHSSLKIQSPDELDHSGSIFSIAPPPSSLPLPRFSLRPKPGCNADGGGVHAGATDDLRSVLRLPKAVMKTGSSSGDPPGFPHP